MDRKRPRRSASPPKKPQPEARGPSRAWSGAWSGAGGTEARSKAPRNGHARPSSTRDAEKGANGVSDGVALGYRVIQEYLRQGERVARSFWSPGENDGDRYDPSRLLDRALRSAQDLAGAFSEMVRVLAKNAPSPMNGAAAGGFDFDPPRKAKPRGQDDAVDPAGGRSRSDDRGSSPVIAISVRSRRPVKVALQLDEAAARGVLQVPPLARSGSGTARLRGVSIVAGPVGKGVAVNLEVRPDVAKGRYQGPVLDARTSRPVGFVSVDVGA
jgi:hypothetical protein